MTVHITDEKIRDVARRKTSAMDQLAAALNETSRAAHELLDRFDNTETTDDRAD